MVGSLPALLRRRVAELALLEMDQPPCGSRRMKIVRHHEDRLAQI